MPVYLKISEVFQYNVVRIYEISFNLSEKYDHAAKIIELIVQYFHWQQQGTFPEQVLEKQLNTRYRYDKNYYLRIPLLDGRCFEKKKSGRKFSKEDQL